MTDETPSVEPVAAEPVETPIVEAAPTPVAEPVAAPQPVATPTAEPTPEPPTAATPEPVVEPVAEAAPEPDPAPVAAPLSELVEEAAQPVGSSPTDSVSSRSIRNIVVRVGAELGRATLPLSKAVGLAPGSVIELDRAADDPIDLYVNGRRFATGQLLLVDQTDWAIRIDHVLNVAANPEYFVPDGEDLI